nr:hypothetical protein [Tanacetum cinerariifolium]
IIDSLDMSYDREQIDQNDDDDNLANERDLLASLIKKLKCEIDDSKNCNKLLETSNKVLVDKLKGNVVGARETIGTTMVQKSGIQCYNFKEFRHVAKECQKPKRLKDETYHKEKMLLCKQEEAGFQLNAEQANLKDDTDDEPEDQELEAHYMYMAQIQE